jgi:protein-S-isoprenylcysteine O-methyltransferase Ste14
VILWIKNLTFTVIVPGSVAVYVPLWLARGRPEASGPTVALAVTLFAAGTAIYAWTVWDFATFGRGTPAPIDAPQKLVVRGLYRFSRNPMYVGVLTVLLGHVALFRWSGLVCYAAAVLAGFHTWIVVYEEPRLASTFGNEYDVYRRQVGRWLPRIRRGSGIPG